MTKIELLSKERLSSYNDDISEHYKNLRLIASITTKVASLEIILRNVLDYAMSANDANWVQNSVDEKIIKARNKILAKHGANTLHHHQYISRLTLGMVIHAIRANRLQNAVMNLRDFKFKKYDANNKEKFTYNGRVTNLANHFKVDIVLSLLQNLRNRCYHWENILKVRVENGITYPRLTTSVIKNTPIGLHPSKIEQFLDDLICLYDKELLDYC